MPIFDVAGKYEVQYMGDDGNVRTDHKRVEGQVQSPTVADAVASVKRAIRHEHTPCWSLNIGEILITPRPVVTIAVPDDID
jgi:hypothetical protein